MKHTVFDFIDPADSIYKTVAWKKLWLVCNDRPTDGSGDSIYRKNGRVFAQGSRLWSH